MLSLPSAVEVYLASDRVDMRKGFEGLSAIVRNQWSKDLYSGHIFAFVGRRLDRVKLLWWDRGGPVLYYKRLERGRFCMPDVDASTQVVRLDAAQLSMLLEGIDWRRVRLPPRWQPRRDWDSKKNHLGDRQTIGNLI